MIGKENKNMLFSYSSCSDETGNNHAYYSPQPFSHPKNPLSHESSVSHCGVKEKAEVINTHTGSSHIERVQCSSILPFSIKRDGSWFYKGKPIKRKHMVCLFASLLERGEEGEYWLETPTEKGIITVEDVPFVALDVYWTGHGQNQVVSLRTNIDQMVCIGLEHPLVMRNLLAEGLICEGEVPYLHIRDGAGKWPIEARVSRLAYYELLALSVPGCYKGKKFLGIWSQNVFFPLSQEESSLECS